MYIVRPGCRANREREKNRERERGGESGSEKREIQTGEIISRIVARDGLIKIVNRSTASKEGGGSGNEFFSRIAT